MTELARYIPENVSAAITVSLNEKELDVAAAMDVNINMTSAEAP